MCPIAVVCVHFMPVFPDKARFLSIPTGKSQYGEKADKKEWYAYHLIDDYRAFQKQISDNHLERLSADNGVFLSRDARKAFGKSVLSVLDRELSNKEKERLAENKYWIFVYMSVDANGKILFVELSSNWLMEEVIKAKHMSNILRQVKTYR